MSRIIKRLCDFFFSLIGLLILAPVLAVIACAIYIRMGSPIMFKQPRPGKNGEIFTFYKFRTMTDERDSTGKLLPDEKRLTTIGQFIRKTSLDEFPQLWNVLKGDMSLVGPRPLLVAYLDRYTPEQARRHEVKPGITGWAQINGRNTLSWEEKFKLDVWYVDNWSLWLDLKILFNTFIKVIKKEGISHPNYATMTEFQGNLQVNNEQ
ncbi:MAG TPA: sugar transferase [Oculatellaceae cyanobacterium]|jgi:lipopolysaccharide/colanic/teichoic acid biosynthesis glycosyltransferase